METIYGGEDPARYVISRNIMRRHLKVGQRAAIALNAIGHYKSEGRVKQAEALERGRQTRYKAGSASIDAQPASRLEGDGTRATTKAAKDVGTGRSTIERLSRVEKEAPDLYEKVVTGELTVNGAYRLSQGRQNPEPVKKSFKITSKKSKMNADADKRGDKGA